MSPEDRKHASRQSLHDGMVANWPDTNHRNWDNLTEWRYHMSGPTPAPRKENLLASFRVETLRRPTGNHMLLRRSTAITPAQERKASSVGGTGTHPQSADIRPPLLHYVQSLPTSQMYGRTMATQPQRAKRDTFATDRSSHTLEASVHVAKNVAAATPIGSAYVPKKYHFFRKTIPFGTLFQELASLQLTLRQMNPADAVLEFQPIQGATRKFYKKVVPDHHNRNALACAQIGGTMADWKTVITEKLPITSPTMTDDTVSIDDGAMRCNFDNGKSQLACIQHIAQVATAIGTYFTI